MTRAMRAVKDEIKLEKYGKVCITTVSVVELKLGLHNHTECSESLFP